MEKSPILSDQPFSSYAQMSCKNGAHGHQKLCNLNFDEDSYSAGQHNIIIDDSCKSNEFHNLSQQKPLTIVREFLKIWIFQKFTQLWQSLRKNLREILWRCPQACPTNRSRIMLKFLAKMGPRATKNCAT